MNKFDAVPSEEEVDDENSDKCMSTISRHFFGDELDKPSFSISILENMKEEYGLFVWPCSIILAEYVWQQRFRFSGVSVVELGAGTSLPGLVAAKVGSDVTLTDDSDRIEVLENMKSVCELNKLKCKVNYQNLSSLLCIFTLRAYILLVMGLTWGVWDASVFNLHPKIILGADVFYDTSAFDDLFATLTFLLKNSPGSVFITTYHNRRYSYFVCLSQVLIKIFHLMCSGHHLIEFLMVKWGLKCVKLLDGFSFLPPDKASGLSGNIQLAEIVLSGELTEETSSSVVR
ncbi:hypothetical protein Patl1_29158 [Pistacia atlantica]|uniref:Uncharacterized protein n=1 Tax=Pistacia atlantica TaxID=434234 RepID=A0ACC1BC84_9ROSI|nr:hypothetical protein Patl1_29158 [Pistacia atlantica]